MTSPRPRASRAAAAILSIGLVAASCSSDDDASPDDSGSTATVATDVEADVADVDAGADETVPDTEDSDADETDAEQAGSDDAPEPDATVGETSATTDAASETPAVSEPIAAEDLEVVSFPVPEGSRPHDVAPALDGGVWYTAQRREALGYLDPESGEVREIPLGSGSAPHGVIVDDDGLAWITDGGLNAIVSVDPADDTVTVYPLPDDSPDANLNTAAFDGDGILWFTGQSGIYGRFDPAVGEVETFESPRGPGPYGIAATPGGDIYFASLAGSFVGAISSDGSVLELDPPTDEQGARRVWSDSAGSIWVSEWLSGQLSRYVPETDTWTEWPLPGTDPSTYAVYVDDVDQVWVSDFNGNALHRFDPGTETFDTFALPAQPSDVRQILGRPGEIWGAESANDSLVVVRAAE